MTLRLKNIQPNDWSPIVMGRNEVTFLRGNFADNMWSTMGAAVTYIDADLSHVEAPASGAVAIARQLQSGAWDEAAWFPA